LTCLVLGLVLAIRLREARAVLVFGVVSFVALVAMAYLLSLAGATYVPRRTGFTRVLQLWPLLPAVVLGALVAVTRKGAPRYAAVSAFVLAAVAVGSLGSADVWRLGRGQPSSTQLDAVASLPIAKDSTVLTNAFTQNYVALMTPGDGLLDGHAPYLERDLLARSNAILTSTRQYFRDPAGSPFPFDEYGVDYVLAAKRPYAVGTPAIFSPEAVNRLGTSPRLRLLAETADLVLYEVVPDHSPQRSRRQA
jgi:hypothetical protein